MPLVADKKGIKPFVQFDSENICKAFHSDIAESLQSIQFKFTGDVRGNFNPADLPSLEKPELFLLHDGQGMFTVLLLDHYCLTFVASCFFDEGEAETFFYREVQTFLEATSTRDIETAFDNMPWIHQGEKVKYKGTDGLIHLITVE